MTLPIFIQSVIPALPHHIPQLDARHFRCCLVNKKERAGKLSTVKRRVHLKETKKHEEIKQRNASAYHTKIALQRKKLVQITYASQQTKQKEKKETETTKKRKEINEKMGKKHG